jgi:RNA polymerase sigma factor (sigma-70 family)
MRSLDDVELLSAYATQQSEEAFAALVERHVSLVYSSALRQARDPQLAEEITQAVFMILARKAGRLRRDVILPGWLCRTAQFTASNALKAQRRRQHWEQEAQMNSIVTEPEPDVWPQIAPLLDEAVTKLGEADRNAVVLRFYQNRPLEEVGQVLGLSAGAAQKRVSRALEKLRKFFAKHGVHSSTDAIAETISSNSIQTAPALLAKTITAAALAKGAAASLSTVTLVKATLVAMKTKTIIATAAASIIVAGVGGYLAYLVQKPKTVATPPTPIVLSDKVPVQMANTSFRPDGDRNGTFLVEVDPDTLRTTNSAPAVHIKGPLATDSSVNAPNPMAANGTYKKTDNSSSNRYFVTKTSSLFGKHIRMSFWLKTRDVRGWASAFVIILGMDGRHLQYDDMSNRPVRGTTDWQEYEIVTDLPDEACIIYFGPDLYGPGELWSDDFRIDLAPADLASTDDRNWRITGESDPTVYSEADDFTVTHNGHATVCISYTPNGTAPRGTHMRLAHDFYGSDSDKYSGHTVRMTGWVKTENVSDRIEPCILPYAGWYKLLAKDSMVADSRLRGSRDWTQFSITCAIPEDTEYLYTGFNFFGSGKAWIDTESIKLAIVR